MAAYTMVTMMLIVMFSCSVCAEQEDGNINIWNRVQQKAAEDDDPKAIWRELKKLTAEDLLVCGKQFCSQTPSPGIDNLIITVNAILSYHTDKTSYLETANAVAHFIALDDNPVWIMASMKWIGNNDHHKQIPNEGRRAIISSLLTALQDAGKSREIICLLLRQSTSRGIMESILSEEVQTLRETYDNLIANSSDDTVVQAANSAKSRLAKWLKNGLD